MIQLSQAQLDKYPLIPKEFQGIKLHLDWRELSPAKFMERTAIIHQDDCAMHSLQGWDEDNYNCGPKYVSMITGRMSVFRINGLEDDKIYFQVNINIHRADFEIVADKNKLDRKSLNYLWELPE